MKSGFLSAEDIRRIIRDSCGSAAPTAGEAEYVDRHIDRYINTLKQLPGQSGKLLDVGCFPGHLSLLASQLGWSVAGVSRMDGTFISSSFEERMKSNGIAVLNVDVERDVFPFPDDHFDAVLFNETVEHLPYNPYHALDQIWRVL